MHSYNVNLERRNRPIWLMVALSISVVTGLTAIVAGLEEPWTLMKYGIPSASLLFLLIYQLFDKVLWKVGVFRFIFQIHEPDISGHWEGTLKSSVNGKDSRMVATIKQTWSKMGIVSPFENSDSCSFTAVFFTEKSQPKLVYNYENVPHTRESETMTRHIGTAELHLREDNQRLIGTYFTSGERKSEGTINLKRKLADG